MKLIMILPVVLMLTGCPFYKSELGWENRDKAQNTCKDTGVKRWVERNKDTDLDITCHQESNVNLVRLNP